MDFPGPRGCEGRGDAVSSSDHGASWDSPTWQGALQSSCSRPNPRFLFGLFWGSHTRSARGLLLALHSGLPLGGTGGPSGMRRVGHAQSGARRAPSPHCASLRSVSSLGLEPWPRRRRRLLRPISPPGRAVLQVRQEQGLGQSLGFSVAQRTRGNG